jgi:thioredoxin reductase (NADPH)
LALRQDCQLPGVIEEISGADLLQRMRDQATSFGAVLTSDRVQGADLLSPDKVVFGNNGVFTARALIMPPVSWGAGNGVKGEDELLGHGVSYCATCDAGFFKDQEVVVAGNSDEAMRGRVFNAFCAQVHFLSPTPELKAPAHLIEELHANPKVQVFMGASLREITGNGKVNGVRFALRGQGEQTLSITALLFTCRAANQSPTFCRGRWRSARPAAWWWTVNIRRPSGGICGGRLAVQPCETGRCCGCRGCCGRHGGGKVLRGRKQLVADGPS